MWRVSQLLHEFNVPADRGAVGFGCRRRFSGLKLAAASLDSSPARSTRATSQDLSSPALRSIRAGFVGATSVRRLPRHMDAARKVTRATAARVVLARARSRC